MHATTRVGLDQLAAPLRARIGLIAAAVDRPLQLSAGRHRGCDLRATDIYGVDVLCTSAVERYRLTRLAIDAGITRIGFYRGYVHLDMHPALPTPVLWVGTGKGD